MLSELTLSLKSAVLPFDYGETLVNRFAEDRRPMKWVLTFAAASVANVLPMYFSRDEKFKALIEQTMPGIAPVFLILDGICFFVFSLLMYSVMVDVTFDFTFKKKLLKQSLCCLSLNSSGFAVLSAVVYFTLMAVHAPIYVSVSAVLAVWYWQWLIEANFLTKIYGSPFGVVFPAVVIYRFVASALAMVSISVVSSSIQRGLIK